MGGLRFIKAKLGKKTIWERFLRERLSEPVHLNILSFFILLFGSFRSKVYFDMVVRPQHAYALLEAADSARVYGYKQITVIEFGVASGAGLLNMIEIGRKVTEVTGIEIDFVGFDNATGMPEPIDYRDHPEYYSPGDFQMQSQDALERALPKNARLIVGDIKSTVRDFINTLNGESPIGFVSIDVDYYSSTVDCMPVFEGVPEQYLPVVGVYLDDIQYRGHSIWAGELLAIEEFNQRHTLRKIGPTNFIRESRLFKKPNWLSHMFTMHVFEHPRRLTLRAGRSKVVLNNPYLE